MYEFGIILWKNLVMVIFKIINKGDKFLVIFNVIMFCGCMVVDWIKELIVLGKIGIVSFIFDVKVIGCF